MEFCVSPGYSTGRQPHFLIICLLPHSVKQAGLEYLYPVLRNMNSFLLEQFVAYGCGKFTICERKVH